jgi:hypothetical protein
MRRPVVSCCANWASPYEGEETRQLALDSNFIPVVPPKSNRLTAWEYDREMYKRGNEIERLFRRLKCFDASSRDSKSSM